MKSVNEWTNGSVQRYQPHQFLEKEARDNSEEEKRWPCCLSLPTNQIFWSLSVVQLATGVTVLLYLRLASDMTTKEENDHLLMFILLIA